jgi:hypothetical protein
MCLFRYGLNKLGLTDILCLYSLYTPFMVLDGIERS